MTSRDGIYVSVEIATINLITINPDVSYCYFGFLAQYNIVYDNIFAPPFDGRTL